MAFRRNTDPRQARYFTVSTLRWIIRNRAWSGWYLLRYWRFLMFRLRSPHVITEGFVFIGKRTKLHARKGYGRLIVGRWVHFGEGNFINAHEGTLRIGDKTVFGRYNTVQSYLDVEIGGKGIIADWIYICDFDHVFADVHRPITEQGIVKSPVRIGPDVWIGTKVSVLRGTTVGNGCVLAANSVIRGVVPPMSVMGGVPARLLKDRVSEYRATEQQRIDVADIARKTQRAAREHANS
ncbi:MAG: acyltransferase [Candidatus Nanopelagicales bacterium]|jgi:acetyltransferase-like isoleucine patch superfamily enzyme